MSKKYGTGKTGASTAEEWSDWLGMKIESPGDSWPSSSVVHLMEVMREMAQQIMVYEAAHEILKDPLAFPKDRQEDS